MTYITNKSDRVIFSARTHLIARFLALVIGTGLIGWAFSNDVRITGGPGFGVTQAVVLAVGLINLLASTLRINMVLSLLLIQLSLGVTLIAGEWLLRTTLAPRYYPAFQLDSRYIYNLIPGARKEYVHAPVNGGQQIIYRINSRGFRGEEFAEKGAAKRIVIYGDSFIQAEFTPLEETLAEQLEDRLAESISQPVEVINAGIAGYGPDQILRRLKDELGWLQPDLVIVAIFAGNDFGDLVRNKLYRLSPNGSLIENDYSYSDEVILNATLASSELFIKRVARDALSSLRASFQTGPAEVGNPVSNKETSLQQHLTEYREYIEKGDNVVRELAVDPYSADMSFLPDSPSAEFKRKMMDAVIAQIGITAKSQNIPLLLVIIPHPMDLLGGDHASGKVDLTRYPDYLPTRLTDTVQAIAARHGIDYINLYPHFSAADDRAALYLKGGDDHWNSLGQRQAAEIIVVHLLNTHFRSSADEMRKPDILDPQF